VGLFENLPLTVAGAFGIGILVNYLPSQTQKTDSLFLQSMPRNVPFIVLLLVFLFVPARMLTERGVRNARRFKPPKAFPLPVTAAGLGALLLLLVLTPHIVRATDVTVYSAAVAYAIIFMSLGMLVWMSGQISLCHLGFAALGATTSGKLMTLGFFGWLPIVGDKTVSWPVAILLGGLVAVPFGAIVAIPAIRLAGIYVAIATFGFGILLQQAFYLAPVMFDNGALVQAPRPGEQFSVGPTAKRLESIDGTAAGLFGIDFSNERNYYYLALAVLVLMAAVVLLVQRSRLGALLRAMADSPVALEAHGANTNVMRIVVFCLSAFMAGVGGGVLAGVTQSASGSPGGTFDYTISLIFVAVLGFCGRRPILSPILAAFAFQVVKIYPPFDDPTMIKYRGVMFGALAIFVAVAPALNLGSLLGKRGKERALDDESGGGSNLLADRLDLVPIQPVSIRTHDLEPALVGSKGGGA
jgi:ABC-type branched-subunit amino acid transport system permease subunit